jgi:hypothetical protein
VTWPQVGTVHVHPHGTHGHVNSKHCACGPTVERWTDVGRRHVRIVHRHIDVADPPRAEQVLPGPRATHDVHESP